MTEHGTNERGMSARPIKGPCPNCGSTRTGPSFTFKWDKDESGVVAAHDPFLACSDCEHVWQIEGTVVLAPSFDPSDPEAVETIAAGMAKSMNRWLTDGE